MTNAKKTARTFKPRSAYVAGTSIRTQVAKYTWTRESGMRVTFTDGLECKSDYTLPQMLKLADVSEVRL